MTIFDQIMQEEYDSWGIQPPEHSWCTPEQTRFEVEFLKKSLSMVKTDSILDLQCSWGRHALMLGSEGYIVLGADISESMIARAKKQASISLCTASFEVLDFRNIKYISQFDIVYQVQSSFFEAWRSPTEVCNLLLGVWKILKPKGRYLFGWNNNWNTSKGAEQRWRILLTNKGITTYDSCDLPFHNYGVAEQIEIVRFSGFTIAAMYNNYDGDEPYNENKPGLIIIARKEGDK